jgi:hypothetical protein
MDHAGVDPNVAKGVALGKRAAADIIARRANDNSRLAACGAYCMNARDSSIGEVAVLLLQRAGEHGVAHRRIGSSNARRT